MSAGMINTEGVNVDLYIPRKCAAVPVGPPLSPRTVPLPNRPPPALRFLLRLLVREACYVANPLIAFPPLPLTRYLWHAGAPPPTV